MSIIRWTPVRDLTPWGRDFWPEFSSMHRDLNRMLDAWVRGGQVDDGSLGSFWTPAVDVEERPDAYVVAAELPGLTKEDVKISIEGNILTIKGEKKEEETKKDREHFRSERIYGSFTRSFTLPGSVKTDKIDASYKNGVLTITIPKTEEVKSKSIEIKVQ